MTWDEYYYKVADAVKENSKCFSRKIGAILVRDKLIISTGYNGPPEGIKPCDQRKFRFDGKMVDFSKNQGECPRYVLGYKSGQGLDICLAAHAEENCILNASVIGVSTKNATMYMTCGIPCKNCLIKIIRAKISECVCTSFNIYDEASRELMANCDVNFRLYDCLLGNGNA